MSPEKIQVLLVIWAFGLIFIGVACWAVSLGQLLPKSEAEREFDRKLFDHVRTRGRYDPTPSEFIEENPFLTTDREYTKLGIRLRRLAKLFPIAGIGLFAYAVARPYLSMLPF